MLLDSIKLYCRYVDISLRSQMQYRASFLIRTLAHFLITGAEFLGFVALFQRFGQIQGRTLPRMGLLYGIISVAFAIAVAVARGFDIFPPLIKAGDFDRVLLRPRTAAFQVLSQELQLIRLEACRPSIAARARRVQDHRSQARAARARSMERDPLVDSVKRPLNRD